MQETRAPDDDDARCDETRTTGKILLKQHQIENGEGHCDESDTIYTASVTFVPRIAGRGR